MRTAAVLGISLLLLATLSGLVVYTQMPEVWHPIYLHLSGKHQTPEEAMELLRPEHRPDLIEKFNDRGLNYPPVQSSVLIFKKERRLEWWAMSFTGRWHFIQSQPLQNTSLPTGPRLSNEPGQWPEGIYAFKLPNPNHFEGLALPLDFPNEDDRRYASYDKRSQLRGRVNLRSGLPDGHDFLIPPQLVAELAVTAEEIGRDNLTVIIAPQDLRTNAFAPEVPGVDWERNLYTRLRRALEPYPATEVMPQN